MKNEYSVLIKTNKLKKVFSQSNTSFMALFGSALFSLFLMTACGSDTFPDEDLSIVEDSTISLDRNSQEAKNVGENIKNSYARLASKRSDVCPKLIQAGVDNPVIKRAKEVMVDDHCDYFLYPRDGQNISVGVSDDQIEALLIVPTLHNFADGKYQVNSYDKHVIRLNYNGANYKPEDFIYDVAVTVSD